MKVLIINGSPRLNGNTTLALDEIIKIFDAENVATEVVRVGGKAIQGCSACGYCAKNHRCVVDDLVNETASKLKECDGMIVASPVYYASANGALIAFLDRLFFSASFDKSMKVGMSVVVARRGGLSATFDQLNKYFTISGMPIVSGQYWNSVHGMEPGEAKEDAEGLQGARTLARNMTFLMKSIALGKEKYGLPQNEPIVMTNFVR